MTPGHLATAATALALTLALGPACSRRGEGVGRSEPGPGVPLQLAAELLGRDDDRDAHEFNEWWISRCMRNRDRSYRPVPWDVVRVVGQGLAGGLDERRDHGFGISLQGDSSQLLVPDPNLARLEPLPAREQQAWVADRNRCIAQAGREVERRVEALDSALNGADRHFRDAFFEGTDGRAEKATAGWRRCMRGRGLAFPDSEKLLHALEEEFRVLPPGDPVALERFQRREIAAAVADHQCEERFVEPVRRAAVRAFAACLGHRYGVTSIYSRSWHLRKD